LQRPSEDNKKRQKIKGSGKKPKKPAKLRKLRKNASLRKLSDDANKRRLKDVGSKKSPKSGAFRKRPIKGANKRRRTIFGELKRQGAQRRPIESNSRKSTGLRKSELKNNEDNKMQKSTI
jgi:hypothetical protein